MAGEPTGRAQPPLVVIAGPTASGKSDLALHLAADFDGEIVNCDSLQVYRCFEIGTAKPSHAERRIAPHHLIDVCDPHDAFTAGDYSRLARESLKDITSRGRLPLVVGGTGFYLRALLDGLFAGPARDDQLRRRLKLREDRRGGALHRLLRRLDPAAAARIHEKDVNKVMRALEVRLLTGRPMTELHRQGRDRLTGYRVLKIGLNPLRPELHARIDQRARLMFERGLVDEVRSILARGYAAACKPFESLGYAQALSHLRGEIGQEEAITLTQIATRQYAKRQWTWFRHDQEMVWLDGFGSAESVKQAVGALLREFLAAD